MTTPKRIIKLSQEVINKIAAGEVVQHPSNALKELIENSLDAGSTNIKIHVSNGGLDEILIEDNGCGINKEDFILLCERFATSKLSKYDDIYNISTYGFRGEALASISFCSQITITSKTPESECGYTSKFIDGKMVDINNNSKILKLPVPCAGMNGTQIVVKNLFYNMPLRKKALQSKSNIEYNLCLKVVSYYAIHNPNVTFVLKKINNNSRNKKRKNNSETHLNSKDCKSVLDMIKLIYGNELTQYLLNISLIHDKFKDIKINGYVSNCDYTINISKKSNKNKSRKFGKFSLSSLLKSKMNLILFINHRLVESNMIKKCVMNVYSQYMAKTHYPFVYLSILMPPQILDVNVHPTKKEVKFLHQESLIQLLENGLNNLLEKTNNYRTYTAKSLQQLLSNQFNNNSNNNNNNNNNNYNNHSNKKKTYHDEENGFTVESVPMNFSKNFNNNKNNIIDKNIEKNINNIKLNNNSSGIEDIKVSQIEIEDINDNNSTDYEMKDIDNNNKIDNNQVISPKPLRRRKSKRKRNYSEFINTEAVEKDNLDDDIINIDSIINSDNFKSQKQKSNDDYSDDFGINLESEDDKEEEMITNNKNRRSKRKTTNKYKDRKMQSNLDSVVTINLRDSIKTSKRNKKRNDNTLIRTDSSQNKLQYYWSYKNNNKKKNQNNNRKNAVLNKEEQITVLDPHEFETDDSSTISFNINCDTNDNNDISIIDKYANNNNNNNKMNSRSKSRSKSQSLSINKSRSSSPIKSLKNSSANNNNTNGFDLVKTISKTRIKVPKEVSVLIETIDSQCDNNLREVFNKHVYVGCVDGADETSSQLRDGNNFDDTNTYRRVMFQHNTALFLCDVYRISRVYFFELCVRQIGNFSNIFNLIDKSLPNISSLVLMALSLPEASFALQNENNNNNNNNKYKISKDVENLLCLPQISNILLKYFNININIKNKCLTSIPSLLNGYYPPLLYLPMFLLRLATQIEWFNDNDTNNIKLSVPLFKSISMEIARFYQIRPPKFYINTNKKESLYFENKIEKKNKNIKNCRDNLGWIIEHILFRSFRINKNNKYSFNPPNFLCNDGSIVQVACTKQLYKVFERC